MKPLSPQVPDLSRRRLMAIGLAAGTTWTLAACSEKKPAATTAAPTPAAAALAGRVYVVGTDAAYAPFESQGPGGDIVGFDMDLLNAIAAKAGISLKFVNTPWEGIFNTLANGERDLVISAVTITPERQQTMDFSAPYFDATQLIAVKAGSKVQRFDDLKTLKVGVQNGTTGDEVVQKLQGRASPDIRRFESTPLALKELESGGVDAVVADNGVVAHYIVNNPAAQFVSLQDASFAPEQYGIALKKGNAELRVKINAGLAAIRADGTYDTIYARYFGTKK